MVQAEATAKYIRTSAQKAGLVLALIRGRAVNQALATLKFTRKTVAKDIAKVLQSAIANAQQKDGFGGDLDRLFVSACYANNGPSQKRVRPAPIGGAFGGKLMISEPLAAAAALVLKRPVRLVFGRSEDSAATMPRTRPAKLLRSAIANVQQKTDFGGDVDRLYVAGCWANQGPSMKRIRPAPMGRAFRVVKRTTHLTVAVTERPVKVAPVAAPGGAPARKKAAPKAKASAPKARADKKLDKE